MLKIRIYSFTQTEHTNRVSAGYLIGGGNSWKWLCSSPGHAHDDDYYYVYQY